MLVIDFQIHYRNRRMSLNLQLDVRGVAVVFLYSNCPIQRRENAREVVSALENVF